MRAFAIFALTVCSLTAGAAGAEDKKPADPNKRICRKEAVTGSIIGGKSICHTRAEWVPIDEANGRGAEQFNNSVRSAGMRQSR